MDDNYEGFEAELSDDAETGYSSDIDDTYDELDFSDDIRFLPDIDETGEELDFSDDIRFLPDIDETGEELDFSDDIRFLPLVDETDGETDTSEDDSKEWQELSGKIETIDDQKYYFDANDEVYRIDDALVTNNSYELNGYHFETDDMGRIAWVEGDIHLRERDERLPLHDSISDIGMGDELDTDDRGHIVADLFDGPNGLENLVPQDLSVNRGEYNRFEGELAEDIRKENDVRVNWSLNYPEGSFRPDNITVTYIKNEEIDERVFGNEKK